VSETRRHLRAIPPAIASILHDTKPYQISLLEALLSELSQGAGITELHVRGSIANGLFDRSSDVDLVIVVEDTLFPLHLRTLDHLMRLRFAAMLPGWYDTIVPDLGGAGLVYLVSSVEGGIYQVDLYLVPASGKRFSSIQPGEIRCIYSRPPGVAALADTVDSAASQGARAVSRALAELAEMKDNVVGDFSEVCVLVVMLIKRIQRATFFLNCANTSMLHLAIQRLLRRRFAPHLMGYGWYKFDSILLTAESEQFALRLKAAMERGAVSSYDSLAVTFELATDILKTCFEPDYGSVRGVAEFVSRELARYAKGLK
jgi:predicted nucleotidyltransferase